MEFFILGFRVLNLNPTQDAGLVRKKKTRYQTMIDHRYVRTIQIHENILYYNDF